MVLAAE